MNTDDRATAWAPATASEFSSAALHRLRFFAAVLDELAHSWLCSQPMSPGVYEAAQAIWDFAPYLDGDDIQGQDQNDPWTCWEVLGAELIFRLSDEDFEGSIDPVVQQAMRWIEATGKALRQ